MESTPHRCGLISCSRPPRAKQEPERNGHATILGFPFLGPETGPGRGSEFAAALHHMLKRTVPAEAQPDGGHLIPPEDQQGSPGQQLGRETVIPGLLPQHKKHPVYFLRGREQPLAIVGREIEVAAPRARSVSEINARVRNEDVAGIVVPIVALAAIVATVHQPAVEKQVAIIFKSFDAHRAAKLGPAFSRWEDQKQFRAAVPRKK